MKEFKGTKGEWQNNGVSMKGDAHFNIIGTALGGKYKIARVPWVDGYKEDMEESAANAQLIAAAPNLLFACMQAKECYEAKGQLLSFDVSIIIRAVELALEKTEK